MIILETGLMAPDWKDGCITELSVSDECMRSIGSGTRFPRGYYRFTTTDGLPRNF